MTRAWAVVPVKCFARGKSRLGVILSPEAREAIARALCAHVLDVLARSEVIAGVVVATDCDEVERVARARGAIVVRDARGATLAEVVDGAVARVAAEGADAVVVLMADLPRVDERDVRALVASLADRDVVLAPDRHGEGTNALGLSPPDRLRTCFGHRDSFRRHRERARGVGARVGVVRRAGTAWDLDTPRDWAAVAPSASAAATPRAARAAGGSGTARRA